MHIAIYASTLTSWVTELQSWDIVSTSGGYQLLQGTKVQAGDSRTPVFAAGQGEGAKADAKIILEGVIDTVQTSKTQTSN